MYICPYQLKVMRAGELRLSRGNGNYLSRASRSWPRPYNL